jgi:hypothetical protein
MRREFIYLHRSVRVSSLSRGRIFMALGIATVLFLAISFSGSSLLKLHAHLTDFFLSLSGIPVSGVQGVTIFSFLSTINTSSIAMPQYHDDPRRLAIIFVLSLALLAGIYRKAPLGRSFVVFLAILLCTAGAVMFFNPAFQFSSSAYAQTWMRGEFLVWILLPWVSCILLVFTIPAPHEALAWSVLLQVYAILWSSIRLAFCLGVFHFTGIMFLPMFWFCLGILFDLVYIMAFYSLAIRLSMKHILGGRKS